MAKNKLYEKYIYFNTVLFDKRNYMYNSFSKDEEFENFLNDRNEVIDYYHAMRISYKKLKNLNRYAIKEFQKGKKRIRNEFYISILSKY